MRSQAGAEQLALGVPLQVPARPAEPPTPLAVPAAPPLVPAPPV
jgi:hypothetical protein